MYRDSEKKIYKDVTLETPLLSTVEGQQVQVECNEANTITIGESEFIRFTASDYNVVDENGYQLLADNENTIYQVIDGVPNSTNLQLTDVE